MKRKQIEKVTCMLSLPNHYIAVGTSRHVLFIYNYKNDDVKMITVHTKGIECLVDINGKTKFSLIDFY